MNRKASKSALLLLSVFLTGIGSSLFAQQHNKKQPGKTENIVMIALDGMRWQEIFGGADSSLIHNKKFTKDAGSLEKKLWVGDKAEDAMIADIWNLLQSLPEYKDKTTLIVTCDHGRGDAENGEWTSHGIKINHSESIWFAVIGPDTKPVGEVKTPMQIYQGQLAATMAELLGFHYTAPQKILPPIESVYAK